MNNDEAAAGSASDVLSTSDGQKEKKTRGEHCFVHCFLSRGSFVLLTAAENSLHLAVLLPVTER